MFYNPRLDSAEEGRMYAGYRSEEYSYAPRLRALVYREL